MSTVRIVITLKPGILDAAGQAVLQGLRTLGYDRIDDVRIGRCVELRVPDDITPAAIDAMCERFLANPLIEEWRVEPLTPTLSPEGERARVRGEAHR